MSHIHNCSYGSDSSDNSVGKSRSKSRSLASQESMMLEEEQISDNSLRFYEYYNNELDSLINGCAAGELTYNNPTKEHCNTVKRVLDQHIMYLANTGQSMIEIIDFMISLVSADRPDSQDDKFALFNIRTINLLIGKLVNANCMANIMDGCSDHDGENLIVTLLQYTDRYCPKLLVQLLDSCIIMACNGVNNLLKSMAPQTTSDGRLVCAASYPPRLFKCYNWIAYWAFGKYSGNTLQSGDGPQFWMKYEIYNTSIFMLSLRTDNDEIGLSKKVRMRISRTLEYYFNPYRMHISATLAPHLTYYNQWQFNNKLCNQLRRLLRAIIPNSGYLKKAHNVATQHNISYTGTYDIDVLTTNSSTQSTSVARQRQNSVPTMVTNNSLSYIDSNANGAKISTSVGGQEVVKFQYKKTLVVVDGRNMFYKKNSPVTHDINLRAMMEFLSLEGQTTMNCILGQCIKNRFGVNLSEHEYQQFHVVIIFHERHRKVMNSCFQRDPVTGIRGPPKSSNITYIYTPGDMNDDIVAMYIWLSNPGTILFSSDEYSNYAHEIHGKNKYLYTLLSEWLRLFRVTRNEYGQLYTEINAS